MNIVVSDVVIVRTDKVLLVQQKNTPHNGLWGFPGGKLELGETAEQAVRRETLEEIGVHLGGVKFINTYHFDNSSAHVTQHLFSGEFKGDIVLNNDELMAYGWFSAESIELLSKYLRSPVLYSQISSALSGQ